MSAFVVHNSSSWLTFGPYYYTLWYFVHSVLISCRKERPSLQVCELSTVHRASGTGWRWVRMMWWWLTKIRKVILPLYVGCMWIREYCTGSYHDLFCISSAEQHSSDPLSPPPPKRARKRLILHSYLSTHTVHTHTHTYTYMHLHI